MAVPVPLHGTVPPRGGASGRWRSGVRWTVRLVLLVALVAAAIGFVQYQRQVVSYLTHWRGSPTHTEAYVPFPADDLPMLRIAVAGDVGDSGSRLDATAAAMARLAEGDPFDVLLLLGDNVYPSGDPAELPNTVFGPFADVLDDGTELLAILGNHDAPNGDAQLAALGMPGHWWAEERGDVLLVGLDSNQLDNPEQLAFLEDTLRELHGHVEDRRPPPSAVLRRVPGLEQGGPGGLQPAVRALRRAAGALRPRPRLPAQQAHQRRHLRRDRRRGRHPAHRQGRLHGGRRSPGTATSSSASTPIGSSGG